MKLDQIVALIIRLYISYLILSVGFASAMTLGTMTLNGQIRWALSIYTIGTLGIFVVTLTAFFFLWKYALVVAKKILPQTISEVVKTPVAFEQLQTLCFTVIGFWAAADSLAAIFARTVFIISDPAPERLANRDMLPIFCSDGAKFFVGVIVMLGSHTVSKTIQKLRSI